jgi:hypothetical protein
VALTLLLVSAVPAWAAPPAAPDITEGLPDLAEWLPAIWSGAWDWMRWLWPIAAVAMGLPLAYFAIDQLIGIVRYATGNAADDGDDD